MVSGVWKERFLTWHLPFYIPKKCVRSFRVMDEIFCCIWIGFWLGIQLYLLKTYVSDPILGKVMGGDNSTTGWDFGLLSDNSVMDERDWRSCHMEIDISDNENWEWAWDDFAWDFAWDSDAFLLWGNSELELPPPDCYLDFWGNWLQPVETKGRMLEDGPTLWNSFFKPAEIFVNPTGSDEIGAQEGSENGDPRFWIWSVMNKVFNFPLMFIVVPNLVEFVLWYWSQEPGKRNFKDFLKKNDEIKELLEANSVIKEKFGRVAAIFKEYDELLARIERGNGGSIDKRKELCNFYESLLLEFVACDPEWEKVWERSQEIMH